MNILLIFFALPIAVIIISIALQKIFKCPILVAAVIFAIFLIVTFVINNINFLIATIAYAILAFITAYITCIICRFINRNSCNRSCLCNNNRNDDDNVIAISNNQNNGNDGRCNEIQERGTTYQITNEEGLNARINIIPNRNNNNRCGCCRRR